MEIEPENIKGYEELAKLSQIEPKVQFTRLRTYIKMKVKKVWKFLEKEEDEEIDQAFLKYL